MTYKFNVPLHENMTVTEQAVIMRGGKLNMLQQNCRSNWNRLVDHALTGRCTCNAGENGVINILNACVTGRNLKDEYQCSLDILQEFRRQK